MGCRLKRLVCWARGHDLTGHVYSDNYCRRCNAPAMRHILDGHTYRVVLLPPAPSDEQAEAWRAKGWCPRCGQTYLTHWRVGGWRCAGCNHEMVNSQLIQRMRSRV
jgi:hypothetical protein